MLLQILLDAAIPRSPDRQIFPLEHPAVPLLLEEPADIMMQLRDRGGVQAAPDPVRSHRPLPLDLRRTQKGEGVAHDVDEARVGEDRADVGYPQDVVRG